jgi:hypothetical protein
MREPQHHAGIERIVQAPLARKADNAIVQQRVAQFLECSPPPKTDTAHGGSDESQPPDRRIRVGNKDCRSAAGQSQRKFADRGGNRSRTCRVSEKRTPIAAEEAMTPINAPHVMETLREQQAEAAKLAATIAANLKELGHGG